MAEETLIANERREKYWKELTIVEQVERMRQIIKIQGEVIDGLRQEDTTMAVNFRNHLHHNDEIVYKEGVGKSSCSLPGASIVIGPGHGQQQNPDEAYF